MKFRLKKAISLYEGFLKESETVNVEAPASSRDAIIKDVDTIITSLETLATQIAEDIDNLDADVNEEELNEVTKKTLGGKAVQGGMDWLIYARRYKKLIGKMFTMKANAEDLGFAARSEKDPNKKAAMKDKQKAIQDQVKDLDKMIADKSKERGPYVQKTITKAKIEGQIALLKHISGMTDDPEDQRDLKTRMQDLKRREQEEAEALKELEQEQKSKAEEEADKEKEDQLRQQRSDIRDQANEVAKSEDPKEAAKKWDLWIKAEELTIEIAKLDSDQERAKGDIEEAQKDIANYKQKKEEALQKIKDDEASAKDDSTEKTPETGAEPSNEKPADSNEKPAAEKPADSKEKPAAEKPAAEKPADSNEKPAAEKPATEKPADSNEKPAAEKPADSNEKPAEDKEEKDKKKNPKESYSYEEVMEDIENIDSPILESELLLEEGPSSVLDFLIYAKRYRKLQMKINSMKKQSQDLGFAAANLGKSAENADKKAALIDKKRMLDTQISELQTMVNDRVKERGTYVQKAVNKAKIEGQIDLIKHATGLTDNPNDLRDLKTRMQDLKSREREEEEAMRDYVKSAEAEATDVKGDDEVLRLKAVLDDARENLSNMDKSKDPIAYAQADLEVAQADMNYKVEKGDRDGVAAAQEKVAKKQEALLAAQNKEAEQNQSQDQEEGGQETGKPAEETPNVETPTEAPTKTPDAEPASTAEPTAEPASTEAPTTEPSQDNPEVAAIKAKIKEYEDAITVLQNKSPKTKEDTDKIAMIQVFLNKEKENLAAKEVKESLISRAKAAGLTELAEQISTKQDWMLNGTVLYSSYDAQLKKAEYASKLNESKYLNGSIKDKMWRLL